MADQIMDTTENNISLSTDDHDNELGKGYRSCSSKLEPKENSINENDWSSSDDDDDNDDKEITYHHKESPDLKNRDWDYTPYFIWDISWAPLPNQHVYREFSYYKEKIRSIRRQLANDNLILRPIYKDIGYHLDSIHTFQKKVSEFMAQASCYSFVCKLSRSHPYTTQNRLADIVKSVETTLDNLFHSKSITEEQYKMMKIDRTLVRMNYLYFVSETHKEEIPVRPIMMCNDGPTEGISRFLGRLLGLLFNDATHCKKFHKAVNIIHAMEFYQQTERFQPTTLFASFNIDKLCLTFSHQQVISALEHFLSQCTLKNDHIQDMTIETILQLVRLVLDNQYFVYNYKFYQQTQGGASGSLLTIPLVYIYLFYWQQHLLGDLINNNELFFRYQDEVFITWNRSEDELRSILTTANTQFPQPLWDITDIGSTIHCRDIQLCNRNGVLQTSVYHEHMYHDRTLPEFLNILQVPIQKSVWKWLRKSLLTAIRYCSTNDAFHEEIDDIKATLHIHGHSDEIYYEGQDEILEDFGVPIDDYRRSTKSPHDIMRENIFNYDQYRKTKKAQRQQQSQQEITLQLPYPSTWTGKVIANFEQEINRKVNEHFGNHPPVKEFKLKLLQNQDYSFPIDHFLIKKRPDIDYLTLPEWSKKQAK